MLRDTSLDFQERSPVDAEIGLWVLYGVKECWVIDPNGPSAEVYRREKKRLELVKTLGGSDSLTSRLFPGFSLPLKDLVE